jgi:hypothetical protein
LEHLPMKLAPILIAAAVSVVAAGCWYTSQPTESPIGTNCTTQTYGLAFISSPNTTCEQSAQPPVGQGAQNGSPPVPAGAQKSVAPNGNANPNQ